MEGTFMSLMICLSVQDPVLGIERGYEGYFFNPFTAQRAVERPGLGR